MRTIFLTFLLIFFTQIIFGQERKIKKALEALSENNFNECFKLVEEYNLDSPELPLGKFVEYKAYTLSGSAYYDLEKGFNKIKLVNDWLKINTPDKNWCKSFGLCSEMISAQMDTIAMKALIIVEENKSDQAYEHYINTYINTPINQRAILSFYAWKYQISKEINTIKGYELYIEKYPEASEVQKAKQKIEEIEYQNCLSGNDISEIELFLKKYPNSIKKTDLEFKICDLRNSIECFSFFMQTYPNYTIDVKRKIEDIEFFNLKKSSNKENLETFISKYPNSKYLDEVKKQLDELLNGVFITASGQGKTKIEATQVALRSGIEQVFGVFISSKTEIFNDQVVADEIASVSSGNIQSYEILNESQLPDESWGITLKALVSLRKLSSFVESKGISVEFKGNLFALNIKQQILNEQSEIKAINEMVGLLHEPMQISFDYVINSKEPQSIDTESKNWHIPLEVIATANKNMDFCANYCIKTLEALSLTSEEVASYKSLNKTVFLLEINYKDSERTFYLRKKNSINLLYDFCCQWKFYISLFSVNTKIQELLGNGDGGIVDNLEKKIDNQRHQDIDHIHKFYHLYDYSLQDQPYRIKDNRLVVNFLTINQKAATFTWEDKLTLEQIEKMTGYTVKPRGIISRFKHGGYVVYEKDGRGLVAAISDLGQMDWTSAKNACDELIINGYSDWHMPSKDELNELYLNLKQIGIRGLEVKDDYFRSMFWSSTEIYSFDVWIQSFISGEVRNWKKMEKFGNNYCHLRAVRTF